jgi:phosphoglycolate phosphatase-like HAD superfamily hydrolase
MRPFAVPILVLAALAACGYPATDFRPDAAAAPAADNAAAAKPTPAAATAAPEETRTPFVVIHFERRDPDYAQTLYDALKEALAKKPQARFDLVAVTRDPGAAERNMADVLHTITEMGMPATRLSLSAVAAADDGTDEVWIYLR